MGDGNKLLVVIATFNEIDSLPPLISALQVRLPAASILVIDDNSPDGTGDWCDQYTGDHPAVSVIHRKSKLGLGTAAVLGMNKAFEQGFSYVATIDADLSHDPAALKAMWKHVDGHEAGHRQQPGVIIGSRYVGGGRIVGWPWYRRISSRLVNAFAQFALGLPTKDNTSAFRIYNVQALRKIDLTRIKSTGYSYLEEILLLLHRENVRFEEFSITFKNRETGKSKVNFQELASSLFRIIKLSLVSPKQY